MRLNSDKLQRIAAKVGNGLSIEADLGVPISTESISEAVLAEIESLMGKAPELEFTEKDVASLRFWIGNSLDVRVGEESVTLRNPDLPLWFDSKKTEIDWTHWKAYRQMLVDQGRPPEIISANERVIDDVLDLSGDPATPGAWARKGLVMGNVQSGKTQNYLGLVNKAFDAGYRVIILLGGHLNALRRQTQERVDEGVLGQESKHLAHMKSAQPERIGVGKINRSIAIHSLTSTVKDFNKSFADSCGVKLRGENQVIFTVKKHSGVLGTLRDWIRSEHFLDPEAGEKLEGPLLLIDDEADYASINTKHHKEEVTATNAAIRQLLALFRRNTYVGYTATPFANIFIDPDESAYTDEDDLFPSDFMIKMPVPDNYQGQEAFFGQRSGEQLQSGEEPRGRGSIINIDDDCGPLQNLKGNQVISEIPESLEEAVRMFVLVIAIRSLRGDQHAHNTMLVNVSHLKVHQSRLEEIIGEYHERIDHALDANSGLGPKAAGVHPVLKDLEETFETVYGGIEETYGLVFPRLRQASARIKVWAVHHGAGNKGERDLDYSKHKQNGLCAIVIGGHKLSRGLTLEGLSVSYFTRNSKAYDTLMQMCRWFGYRPRYGDLCRVCLPSESEQWYSFIASTIRELYQELEHMSRLGHRPSEFGLKVREHPGAMIITAKNKMGASTTEVRSQDLWGQVQRRFRFESDVKRNGRNLQFAKELIRKLAGRQAASSRVDKLGSVIFDDVEYSDLIDFIGAVSLPEDAVGSKALISHLSRMEREGLGRPKVALFSQKGSGKPKWAEELTYDEREFAKAEYLLVDPGLGGAGGDAIKVRLPKRRMDSIDGIYSVKSVHLGNPDDEKLFLSTAAREEVMGQVGGGRAAVSFDYQCSAERDFPGLLIYHFAVGVENLESGRIMLGHGKNPTLGYSLSLPRPENLKGLSQQELKKLVRETKHSYSVNKVHAAMAELGAYEEIDYDE
jgi:hypothetical protein